VSECISDKNTNTPVLVDKRIWQHTLYYFPCTNFVDNFLLIKGGTWEFVLVEGKWFVLNEIIISIIFLEV
jgi:hypothetical protein